jgi:hypothetical protein
MPVNNVEPLVPMNPMDPPYGKSIGAHCAIRWHRRIQESDRSIAVYLFSIPPLVTTLSRNSSQPPMSWSTLREKVSPLHEKGLTTFIATLTRSAWPFRPHLFLIDRRRFNDQDLYPC